MKRRQYLTLQRRRRGAALVEMAVVMPLFILFSFAIIEFGRAMMTSQLVTSAARDGARVAAIDGSTNATVEQVIYDFLEETLGLDDDDVTVTITVSAGPGNADPQNQLANAQAGDKCDVTVSIPFNKVALTTPEFLSGQNLVGSCVMRREW